MVGTKEVFACDYSEQELILEFISKSQLPYDLFAPVVAKLK